MRLTTLLRHMRGLRLAQITLAGDELTLVAHGTAAAARCPSCRRRSQQVHSQYTRRLADQPIGGRQVTIVVHVRRFHCRAPTCPRRTFAEQFPRLGARYARRTQPLQTLLDDIGVTVGGRPGARFAARHGLRISRNTLLRRVRQLPLPAEDAPAVLGMDDFALRRGHRYGTVLVDLQAHRVADVLPDRTAATATAWLAARPAPQLVCRDRAGAYGDAVRQAAPTAQQIADRFHLSKNASEVLERVLARYPAALRAATDAGMDAAGGDAVSAPAPLAPARAASLTRPDSAPPAAADPRRERRRAQYEQVVALYRQGWSLTAISAHVGLCRPTVRKYVRAGAFPERAPQRTLLRAGAAHTVYLQMRWAAGCRDAEALWRELQERGFRGSVRMVQRAVAAWRETPGRRGRQRPVPAQALSTTRAHARPLSPRQAMWLLLRPLDDLTATERVMRARLLDGPSAIGVAQRRVTAFRQMIRTRDHAALDPWLQAAKTCPVPEIRTFAASLQRDYAAVAAALAHPWSSGQVEGFVTKVKLIKRLMFGRGRFDLLRRRVLLAG